jgi:amino acid transporter
MSKYSATPDMELSSKGSHDEKLAHTASGPQEGDIVTADHVARPNLMTRLGLTPKSFRRRTLDDKHNQLNNTLKSRHLNMIAIGGSIGAGLFVGSGGALATGGPGALLIAFGIIGIVSKPPCRTKQDG